MRQWTMDEIKRVNEEAGYFWFSEATMAFFGTEIESDPVTRKSGVYFITSEQPPYGNKVYSVRVFCPSSGNISTYGEFGTTKAHALSLFTEATYLKGEDYA